MPLKRIIFGPVVIVVCSWRAVPLSSEDYYRIVPVPGAADVCIVASAANTKPGSFMLRRVLQAAPVNQIFVNCPGNQWYLDGIPGLGTDLQSSAEALRQIAEDLRGTGGQVLVLGSSMGGYGAVAMGALMQADIVFATGVEFVLNLPGGLSARFLKGRPADLDILQAMAEARSRFIMACGEDCFTDLYGLMIAERSGIAGLTSLTFRNRSHSLPPYLQGRWGFPQIVTQLLTTGHPPFEDGLGTLVYEHDLCRQLQDLNAVMQGRMEGIDDLIRRFEALGQRIEDTHDRSYAHYGQGMALRSAGDVAGSESALRRAHADNPTNFRFLNQLARSLLAAGQHDEAEAAVRLSIRMQEGISDERDPFTRLILSRLLKAENRVAEAVDVVVEELQCSPKSGVYWQFLEELLSDMTARAARRTMEGLTRMAIPA